MNGLVVSFRDLDQRAHKTKLKMRDVEPSGATYSDAWGRS